MKVEVLYDVVNSPRELANIFHIAYTGGPPSGGVLTALAALVDTAVDNYLTTFMHTSATHRATKLTDLSSVTGAVATSLPGTSGGNAGTLAPLSIAAVTSWQIARRYRGGHPRTYMGAMSDAQLSPPDKLNAVFAGNWSTAAGVFIGAVLAMNGTLAGSNLACVSYRTGNALRVTPLVEEILGTLVHENIRSQRRRLG